MAPSPQLPRHPAATSLRADPQQPDDGPAASKASTAQQGSAFEAQLAKLRIQYELKLLRSKYKLICQADADLKKQEEAVQTQRQSWMLTLDEWMLQAEKKDAVHVCSPNSAYVEEALCLELAEPDREGGNTEDISPDSHPAAKRGMHSKGQGEDEVGLDKALQTRSTNRSLPQSTSSVRSTPHKLDFVSNGCQERPVEASINSSCIVAVGAKSPSSPGSPKRTASARKDSSRRQMAQALSKLKKSVRSNEGLTGSEGSSAISHSACVAWRRWLQRYVETSIFEGCVFGIIFTNVIFVGVEVDFMATHPEMKTPSFFVTANYCYCFFFLVELIVRMITSGKGFLSSSNKDWAWNGFDTFVVISSVVETGADIIKASSSSIDMVHFRVIRVIRVTRLLRTFRMLRMVRFIRALRTLIHSIVVTLRAAIWSLLLMFIILYGFGVAFTQAVSDYCDSISTVDSASLAAFEFRAAGCKSEAITTYFATLPRAMFTLFKCIAAGISWHEVVEPLARIGGLWVMLFIVFVTFTLFAVLNVVTGLFCQSAIESAQHDKDIACMQLMANKGYYQRALDQLFKDIDVDDSGVLTVDEFEEALKDKRCQAYFESLDIECADAWALFKLLDADESGSIDRDEFFMGCMQLRGNARAVDIAKMAYDNKVVFYMLEDFMEVMEQRISQILDCMPKSLASRIDSSHSSNGLRNEAVVDPSNFASNTSRRSRTAWRRRREALIGRAGAFSSNLPTLPRQCTGSSFASHQRDLQSHDGAFISESGSPKISPMGSPASRHQTS